ncbi:hypothetical protein [Rhizobium sp. Leaf371]|nr:hypothetical protein [Rhizobium sp. Leaf371]
MTDVDHTSHAEKGWCTMYDFMMKELIVVIAALCAVSFLMFFALTIAA